MPKSVPDFVVGIGGSAGGLKAYMALLEALPSDTGMAFVFIAHLNPTGNSELSRLLSRATEMLVIQAADKMAIEANHVYVIPANADLYIAKSAFKVVSPRTLIQGRHKQVDLFLISLAGSFGNSAIGIILSGGDGDGTEGCKVIRAKGGRTFAQDLSAENKSMPLHAQASGCIEFVLSPAEIAHELGAIAAGSACRQSLG